MSKMKSLKKALIASAMSMVLCSSMFVGTTYAWFTDSVTSGSNIIQTGTLEVGMYYADGTKEVPAADSAEWKNASTGSIFNSKLWEPGYTEVRHIKIANEGSLALKYQLNIITSGEVSKLADVIDVYYYDSAEKVTREMLVDATPVGTLRQMIEDPDGAAYGYLLAVDKSTEELESVKTVTIALKMRETAGNEYHNMSIGSPFIIQLLATQYTAEEDSFNDQYDANAEYDVNNVYIKNVKYETIAEAIEAAKDGETIRLTSGTFNEALNLQGKALTIQGAGQGATIIAGPKDYTTTNIPMQSWAGWSSGQDVNVYALISANKDVTIKDLTVSADPAQIGEVAEFRHQGNCAFVGIHVQSANATIENVDIKNIKPNTVTGNDHHNFGLYITSAIGDTNAYTATYKNGKVSDVNRGGIYCWSDNYTLDFENVTVVGPGEPGVGNGTLTPAAGSENNSAIYAFCSFYIYSSSSTTSSATYENVKIYDSWCVAWWGGASWAWANPAWSTNPPTGVTCFNCGTAN